MWKGSFIRDCVGSSESDILLRHGPGFTQRSQICNKGAVTARALSLHNNTYTSQLNINMTMISLLNGSTVACAHGTDDEENIVGIWTMIGKLQQFYLKEPQLPWLNCTREVQTIDPQITPYS